MSSMKASATVINGINIATGSSSSSLTRLNLPVLREKTLFFVIVAAFLFLMFGAYLFLPDSTMRTLDKKLQQGGGAMLFPEAADDAAVSGGIAGGGHHDDHFDPHQIQDKKQLFGKIEEERARQEYVNHLRKRLELARAQFSTIRAQIEKDKLLFQKAASAADATHFTPGPAAAASDVRKPNFKEALPVLLSLGAGYGHQEAPKAEETQGGQPKDAETASRRDKVREMMRFAWSNYVKHAWGQNELKPISQRGHTTNIFGQHPIGATIVDAVDTLFIMGLNTEYKRAREYLSTLNFDVATEASVFEINIRFVGGMLSAFFLTGDRMFLSKAEEVATRLLPAFDTPTGLPNALVNLRTRRSRNYNWASGGSSILSEFGTLHLEFATLTELTGNKVFLDKVIKIRDVLQSAVKPRGLYPNFMNPRTGRWGQQHSSLAGLGDSFYEYLLKEWLRSGKRDGQARRMYDEAMAAVERIMVKRSAGGYTYVGDFKFGRVNQKMDHLACFSGGMFALGAAGSSEPAKWLTLGAEITRSCRESYSRTATHLGPESFRFDNGNEAVAVMQNEKGYLLRPETIESYFILWRLTKDPKYRRWGWDVVLALEKHCRVNAGFSGVRDVYSYNPAKDDVQQSYFLAETLKYLYLLFSEDTLLPLDRWVFNTEAHPLRIRDAQPPFGR